MLRWFHNSCACWCRCTNVVDNILTSRLEDPALSQLAPSRGKCENACEQSHSFTTLPVGRSGSSHRGLGGLSTSEPTRCAGTGIRPVAKTLRVYPHVRLQRSWHSLFRD